jgi:uncharacterized membrane protein HdeD (DUF308 family)
MNAIEPNWISLLWFAGCATVCALAFLVVAGMFPLGSRPEVARAGGTTLLIAGNAVLLAALATATGRYGWLELRWSTLIIVTGLIVLFAPGLFQAWPSSLRDGRVGLWVLIGLQAIALVALGSQVAPLLPDIS